MLGSWHAGGAQCAGRSPWVSYWVTTAPFSSVSEDYCLSSNVSFPGRTSNTPQTQQLYVAEIFTSLLDKLPQLNFSVTSGNGNGSISQVVRHKIPKHNTTLISRRSTPTAHVRIAEKSRKAHQQGGVKRRLDENGDGNDGNDGSELKRRKVKVL
ncbi:hypothetical protein M426DRAFT_269098 [Hypoxylon sp. CI-4A]|nr:hypothetical protein M426DRAFT_269098 [Hypoxylon sp. CI-4A]